MIIRELKKEDNIQLNSLVGQLINKPANVDIEKLISDSNCKSVAIENNNKLIGVGFLIIHQVPSKGFVGRIEEIVVDEKYRGKGLGRKIMEELLVLAKDNNLKRIGLTSNPKRVAARKLYESLGFKIYNTGIFYLDLE